MGTHAEIAVGWVKRTRVTHRSLDVEPPHNGE